MRVVGLCLILLLAGCAEMLGAKGASQWELSREPSMYPDFSDEGPGYPVLLVHAHTTRSEKEKEYYEKNPVVCLMTDRDEPLPLVGVAMRDAAPCDGPRHDPAAGRLFVQRAEFDSWEADALVIRTGCDDLLSPLNDETPGFRLRTPAHDFHVRWEGGVFRVDNETLHPGEALRITYWIDYGDERNQKMVRVVLDHPGQWLRSLVAVPGSEPTLPVRPQRADGLEVTVPTGLTGLRAVIETVADATPGNASHIGALRIVHGAEGLRDIHVVLGDEQQTVTWYLASHPDGALRLLGNHTPSPVGGRTVGALLDAFPDPLRAYGATGQAVSVVTQWTPRWVVEPSPLQGTPTPCDTCLYAWGEDLLGDPGWQPDPLAHRRDAEGALSLHVTAVDADGTVRTALYSY